MDSMETISDGRLLRVYFCESDRYDGHPLDEAIVNALQSAGISGATVIRGIAGYGGSSVLHTTHVLRLSEDLPLVIEAVDTKEKVAAVLPQLATIAGDGLITTHPIEIHRRRPL
jgi:PII-like signaling protein